MQWLIRALKAVPGRLVGPRKKVVATRPLFISPQETPVWCWVAVAQGVTIALGGRRLSQTQIAGLVFNKNCVGNPDCVKPDRLPNALNALGQKFASHSKPLGALAIGQEISERGFVVCRIKWQSQNVRHVVAVNEVSVFQKIFMVTVHDPAPGTPPTEMTLKTLLVSYGTSKTGTWERSYRVPGP